MKIAVVGKGGVGKTLIAGTLARFFAKNFKVLAIDNDPSMNLIYSLGMDPKLRNEITPISQMEKLIEERTNLGANITGTGETIYNINPKVSDIPDKFKVQGPDNIQLLVLGSVENPSSGCFCSANALVRTILSDLILNRDEVIIIDFEAGLEHLGRGTARGIDTMLIVTAPYKKSMDLSEKILSLTRKMGIKKIFLIGNMVNNQKANEIINIWAEKHELDVIGFIPRDENVAEAEMMGYAPFDKIPNSEGVKALKNIYIKLKEYYVGSD
ncbi:MAG: AAA family ATPase [archaeon]|nr:AAA family ATPase [archaeon]